MSALKEGETVLITGGTGWIGSHIVNEALKAGLKVKLAIRSEEKARALIQALEKIHQAEGQITTILIPDLGGKDAWKEALVDVQAVIHAAIDLSLIGSDAESFIRGVLDLNINLLQAAKNRGGSIKRIVITSSSVTLGLPNAGASTTHYWNADTWNEAAVERSKSAEPDMYTAYAASKTLAEQAVWKFVKEENNPSLILNTVCPNSVFGAPVPGMQMASSGKMLLDASEGKPSLLLDLGPQYHSDVDDIAKLHILGVMKEDLQNKRIIAFATKYSINSLIDTIKVVKPDATPTDKKEDWDVQDNTEVDSSLANQLLASQGGLKDLEFSVRGNLTSV